MLHSKWQHLLVTNSTGITVNDPFATKLGFMAYYHKLDSLVKRLDCSVVVKVKVTEKVQNPSECSSGQYLINF